MATISVLKNVMPTFADLMNTIIFLMIAASRGEYRSRGRGEGSRGGDEERGVWEKRSENDGGEQGGLGGSRGELF